MIRASHLLLECGQFLVEIVVAIAACVRVVASERAFNKLPPKPADLLRRSRTHRVCLLFRRTDGVLLQPTRASFLDVSFGKSARCKIPCDELAATFNCGIGMVLVVAKDKKEEVMSLLKNLGVDYTPNS